MPPKADLSRRSQTKADPYATASQRMIDVLLILITALMLVAAVMTRAHQQESDSQADKDGAGIEGVRSAGVLRPTGLLTTDHGR